jgi:hypothetical protein
LHFFQSHQEFKSFQKIFKDYVEHISSTTSLVGILGIYRISCEKGGKCYVMVLRDVLPDHSEKCTVVADLKGSLVGRISSKSNPNIVSDIIITNFSFLINFLKDFQRFGYYF